MIYSMLIFLSFATVINADDTGIENWCPSDIVRYGTGINEVRLHNLEMFG